MFRLHIVSFVAKSTFSTRKKIIKIYHVKFEVFMNRGFFKFYVMRKSRKKTVFSVNYKIIGIPFDTFSVCIPVFNKSD